MDLDNIDIYRTPTKNEEKNLDIEKGSDYKINIKETTKNSNSPPLPQTNLIVGRENTNNQIKKRVNKNVKKENENKSEEEQEAGGNRVKKNISFEDFLEMKRKSEKNQNYDPKKKDIKNEPSVHALIGVIGLISIFSILLGFVLFYSKNKEQSSPSHFEDPYLKKKRIESEKYDKYKLHNELHQINHPFKKIRKTHQNGEDDQNLVDQQEQSTHTENPISPMERNELKGKPNSSKNKENNHKNRFKNEREKYYDNLNKIGDPHFKKYEKKFNYHNHPKHQNRDHENSKNGNQNEEQNQDDWKKNKAEFIKNNSLKKDSPLISKTTKKNFDKEMAEDLLLKKQEKEYILKNKTDFLFTEILPLNNKKFLIFIPSESIDENKGKHGHLDELVDNLIDLVLMDKNFSKFEKNLKIVIFNSNFESDSYFNEMKNKIVMSTNYSSTEGEKKYSKYEYFVEFVDIFEDFQKKPSNPNFLSFSSYLFHILKYSIRNNAENVILLSPLTSVCSHSFNYLPYLTEL